MFLCVQPLVRWTILFSFFWWSNLPHGTSTCFQHEFYSERGRRGRSGDNEHRAAGNTIQRFVLRERVPLPWWTVQLHPCHGSGGTHMGDYVVLVTPQSLDMLHGYMNSRVRPTSFLVYQRTNIYIPTKYQAVLVVHADQASIEYILDPWTATSSWPAGRCRWVQSFRHAVSPYTFSPPAPAQSLK